jgi:integrase
MAARLTSAALKQLAVGGKISEGGITAERSSAGFRFSVNVMVDGRRVHRRGLGSLREAREFLDQAKADARRDRLNLPKGRKLAQSFAAAADDYLERIEETNGKNIVPKRRQLRLYLVPYFGPMRLDAITGFTVEKYKKRRLDEGAAAATVNRELATLSHLFNRAVEWKWLDRLPTKPVKFQESAGRITALDEAQCTALMTAGVASAEPDCWLFVAFGLNTAMRHTEILTARWEHLDFASRRLFIPDAKAGEREQPITAELADILTREREMREDRQGWVFPSPHFNASVTGHRTRMDRPFRQAVIAAGLDPELITPHVMRHTAITRLVQAGVDLPTIQRISGHKTLAMVLRYTHVHARHIDAAIRAIGRTIPKQPANRITPKLHQPTLRRAGGGAQPVETKSERLEAGSGIEPLYEDLQSSA